MQSGMAGDKDQPEGDSLKTTPPVKLKKIVSHRYSFLAITNYLKK